MPCHPGVFRGLRPPWVPWGRLFLGGRIRLARTSPREELGLEQLPAAQKAGGGRRGALSLEGQFRAVVRLLTSWKVRPGNVRRFNLGRIFLWMEKFSWEDHDVGN